VKPRVKIALAGFGWIAERVHLNVFTRLQGCELVAVGERDAARLKEASRRAPQAKPCRDYRELLSLPEVEALVICLPNALHAEAAVAALERGKALYLEKPLAATLEEGGRVLSAWRRSGLAGMIGFNYRFSPLYRRAREVVRSGALGKLLDVRTVFSSARETSGERNHPLLDLGSHHIDLLRFIFDGEIEKVLATPPSGGSEEGSTKVRFQMDGGLEIQSLFSAPSVDEDRFEIYGERATLRIDRYRSLDAEVTGPGTRLSWPGRIGRKLRSLATAPHALKRVIFPTWEPSYEEALNHFVEGLRSGRPLSPDLGEGYKSLAVVSAAEESARSGKWVRVPESREERFVQR
jgi:predicted dehydrogenase